MQDLIKKYFWLVGIIVVMGSAGFAAKGVSHILEGALLTDSAEVPEVEPVAPQRRPARESRSKSGAALAARNMFCSDCVPAAPADQSETPVDPNAVPITSLPLELLATNVSREQKQSFATIRNTSTASQGAYWAEQEIPGAGKVERIAGGYVDFRNTSTNRLERISLLNVGQPSAPPPPVDTAVAVAGRPTEPAGELESMIDQGIKKVSEDSYEVQRGLVNSLLANPMAMARGARVVPSVKDGAPNGFKLYAIRPSSVYGKIGLRNGDTVTAVNGFDLSSPDKALEVYTKVREASNLTVSVLRRGKPMTLNYTIR